MIIKLYIPEKVGNSWLLSGLNTVQTVHSRLADAFGGYTSYVATGAWKRPDGRVQHEPVEVVEVVTDETTAARHMDLFKGIMKDILDSGELEVLATFNNVGLTGTRDGYKVWR